MPVFYFHVDGCPSDDDGTELANLLEAILFAEEIVVRMRRKPRPLEALVGRHIVIFDEAGNEVKQVPLLSAQG
jgi:hypothetical protein